MRENHFPPFASPNDEVLCIFQLKCRNIYCSVRAKDIFDGKLDSSIECSNFRHVVFRPQNAKFRCSAEKCHSKLVRFYPKIIILPRYPPLQITSSASTFVPTPLYSKKSRYFCETRVSIHRTNPTAMTLELSSNAFQIHFSVASQNRSAKKSVEGETGLLSFTEPTVHLQNSQLWTEFCQLDV